MARYTKHWPTPEALAQNPVYPSTYGAVFLGWEAAAQGERAQEATDARDIGWPMSAKDSARFALLEPGERMNLDGCVYSYN